jgi:hypothetical protein
MFQDGVIKPKGDGPFLDTTPICVGTADHHRQHDMELGPDLGRTTPQGIQHGQMILVHGSVVATCDDSPPGGDAQSLQLTCSITVVQDSKVIERS